MKLSESSLSTLQTTLRLSTLVNIDRILIDEESVLGIDEQKSVAILTKSDTGIENPIAVSRIGVLNKQINLAEAGAGVADSQIEISTVETEGVVSGLKLKGGKIKSEFTTTNPERVYKTLPKASNDTPKWVVPVDEESFGLFMKAVGTLKSENMIISSNATGVSFELVDEDSSSDTISIQIADAAMPVVDGDTDVSFVNYYRIKSLLPLIKAAFSSPSSSGANLVIGTKGILEIEVDGLTFINLPRIG